jgi:hypothetical protein
VPIDGIVKQRFLALFCACGLFAAHLAHSNELQNLTGLPAYPNLNRVVMDGIYRTDTLGHWCMRFWASASDSLSTVENWYRKRLTGASEIDLVNDKTYRNYSALSGIKLALGIDYVVVYKINAQAPTSIDLYRCSGYPAPVPGSHP